MTGTGLPHSEIPGSKVVCTSPRLIAAYHVLHRLLVPRHPPCALHNLAENLFYELTSMSHASAKRRRHSQIPHETDIFGV